MKQSDLRKAAVAGLFYPSDKRKLVGEVRSFLNEAQNRPLSGTLMAAVVPHAGYIYSGRIAAEIYRLSALQNFDSCLILGPNHRGVGGQCSSIYEKGSFETPLGRLEIDYELAQAVLKHDALAVFNPLAHAAEHSIEVQIPFLQIVKPGIKIVPIVMSDYEYETCVRLAQAIQNAILEFPDKKVIILASTDFSHYHSYEKAVKMDSLAMNLIEEMNPEALFRRAESGEIELCGLGPAIVTVLIMKKWGHIQVQKIQYANSGDVTGDKSSVVGYAAIAFIKK